VPERWRVTWLITNEGSDPLALQAAWIPHGRFRGDGRLPLSGDLPAESSRRLSFDVTAAEPPGTVVENAFLILRVDYAGQPWRIFTRMRVEFSSTGAPTPVVEVVTQQSSVK
jgi:hypothetical protein